MKESQRNTISATVFDSCPAPLEPELMTRGTLGFLSGRLFHKPIYYSAMLSPILRLFWLLQMNRRPVKRVIELVHQDSIHGHPRHAAQLYLYSSADPIITAESIESHISIQELRLSSLILYHDFVTSPHVAHLRFHAVEYRRLLGGFLEKVLASELPKEI
jgi:hypothetical protein